MPLEDAFQLVHLYADRGSPKYERAAMRWLEHPAPNLQPGDVVVVADGRDAVVTARVEAAPSPGPLAALLGVAIAPTPLTSDESIAYSASYRSRSSVDCSRV